MMGGFQRRKLLSKLCLAKCEKGDCLSECRDFCPSNCSSNDDPTKPKKVLIAIIFAAAVTFFLVCCYAIYVKFYVIPRRRRRMSRQEQRIETRDEFLDEDRGPVVEHHVWYINTVGLPPSIISSITVCKYKRGDGLVDGTECSVCLNEFQEDESLRLLPKCSHAFHIACIDTWLRSHINCPMCRSPIVTRPAVATSSEDNTGTTSTEEEIQVGVVENESDRAVDDEDADPRVGAEEGGELGGENRRSEEDVIQPMRRSVSLDSLSAFKITQALANVHPVQSDGSSSSRPPLPARGNGYNMQIVPKRGGGSQGLLKFMASSSFGRTLQIGPSSLRRSLSCSGKLFLSRYCRNRNSVLPS